VSVLMCFLWGFGVHAGYVRVHIKLRCGYIQGLLVQVREHTYRGSGSRACFTANKTFKLAKKNIVQVCLWLLHRTRTKTDKPSVPTSQRTLRVDYTDQLNNAVQVLIIPNAGGQRSRRGPATARLLGLGGSYPAGDMDVCLFGVLCVIR
jgi:hypothetical protein